MYSEREKSTTKDPETNNEKEEKSIIEDEKDACVSISKIEKSHSR